MYTFYTKQTSFYTEWGSETGDLKIIIKKQQLFFKQIYQYIYKFKIIYRMALSKNFFI